MKFVNTYVLVWQSRELIMNLCDVCVTRYSDNNELSPVRDGTPNSLCDVCGAYQIEFRNARDRARHLVEVLFTGE